VVIFCFLSGVRLRLLLDGLLLDVLRGGDCLGSGDIDICLSGEMISALLFFRVVEVCFVSVVRSFLMSLLWRRACDSVFLLMSSFVFSA
jgi:hypothetical protein